jgi:acarbose 7IV-phosphotransferase
MSHILILGGTTYDHIVSLSEFPQPVPQTIHNTSFFEGPGSTGTGKAVCLKKLGISNTLYSILGDDVYGQKIIQYLEKEAVDFIYDFDDSGTERHINMMGTKGDRISMFITQSAEHPNMNKMTIEQNILKSDLVVLNIISYCKELIPLLKDYAKPVWTDLHDYNEGNQYHQPFIDRSDYIFLSSDNVTDYKKIMQEFIQAGKEMVVCTHGKNGATALTKNGEWIDEPALPNIEIIDSNGAGDSFFSGFLYAFLQGKSIQVCMRYGSVCGALCITSQQIVSEKLTAKVLEELYHQYYEN